MRLFVSVIKSVSPAPRRSVEADVILPVILSTVTLIAEFETVTVAVPYSKPVSGEFANRTPLPPEMVRVEPE